MKQPNDIKYEIVPYTRGMGLEVNPNSEIGKLYEHFYWVDGNQLHLFAGSVMDFVYSTNINGCIKNAWRIIKPGGHLVLFVEDGKVISSIEKGFDLIVSKKINGRELIVLKKRNDKGVNLSISKRPDKSVCVVRYGGIGDMIQTASIFPHLKDQGYYVALNTDPSGYEIVKHDPHIDEFILQDKEQVPNNELGAFWKNLSRGFSKFINLCESVEGTLLALPARIQYQWPNEVRHHYMDQNYLEHIHRLAGVPMPSMERFYPTTKELKWASWQRDRIKGKVILWPLAGSSVHKTWPYMDQIVARMMLDYNDVHIVLVGDDLCQMIEAGWEAEPRVHLKSGEWSLRQTMTFARYADIVIGPETGIMACVATMEIPKIVFLSHSSIENLTKHWMNCYSMEPHGCECYPCHQMHYGFEYCPRDEEYGTAKCQALIDPDRVENIIKKIFKGEL